MRFRSVFTLSFISLLLWCSCAFAQKRVDKTVNPNAGVITSTADIYDPATGAITPVVQAMTVAREHHVAVPLPGGRVYIAGGYNNRYLRSAELFDPETGFTPTTALSSDKAGALAVRLHTGSILVAGGFNGNYLASADLYDPSSQTVTIVKGLNHARENATATLLNNNTVLVTGGFNNGFLNSAELFNPSSRDFTLLTTTMLSPREGHTATLLPDGKVLIAGGCRNADGSTSICNDYLNTAEIFDPETNQFTATAGTMTTARHGHSATLLPDGKVLIAGGRNSTSVLSSAEIYDPATGTFSPTGSMAVPRTGHTASLSNGKVLLAGGSSDGILNSAEVFANGVFTPLTSTMATARLLHTGTVLDDGRVLLAGGRNADLLIFDVNYRMTADNIAPNILFSADSQTGFVPYAGSGVILAFSTTTGEVIERIATGGKPASLTQLDAVRFAAVSVLDNRIFVVNMDTFSVEDTFTFEGGFGFGSLLTLSPDRTTGYISSTATGAVIKFSTSSGQELGRLGGLVTPAQITVTNDGSTLMIVDTTANEVVFADAGSMTAKFKMRPRDIYPTASFTIYNKPVLNADGTLGVIGSQDTFTHDDDSTTSGLFVFNPATGEILGTHQVGHLPGYTTLVRDEVNGDKWLIFSTNALTLIPTANLNVSTVHQSYRSNQLPSSNVAFLDTDPRYVYYTSSTDDLLFEHDIVRNRVVGATTVGDRPNLNVDQASSLAITPDGIRIAVVNFTSNEIDLLVDTTLLRQTKIISENDQFTGLSILNLSAAPTRVWVSALQNNGSPFSTSGRPNAVELTLQANEQKSLDVAQLFDFSSFTDKTGRLEIEAETPSVAAFSATGRVRAEFLNSYTSSLQGISFYPDYRDQLHDFIIPELSMVDGSNAEITLVNPNFSTSSYILNHYGTDGSLLESADAQLSPLNREAKNAAEHISSDLASGQILLVGGSSGKDMLTSAEIVSNGTSSAATNGSLAEPREGASATSLLDLKILAAGGKNRSGVLKTAQLYDPIKKSFSNLPGTMNSERYRHTATLLLDGRVLLAGGQNAQSISRTAEIFDPATGGFSAAIPMTSARDSHTATRLPDGTILITGGIDGISISATAETFDAATSTFSATGNMTTSRAFHTAVLLQDGRVLIAGGYNGTYLDSAELYDPATRSFIPIAPMVVPRSGHTATLLPDGTVLIAGGMNSSGETNLAEIYDPVAGRFVLTNGTMSEERVWHSATLIINEADRNQDKVLIAGGNNGSETSGTFEVYNPVTGVFERSANLNVSRQRHAAVALVSSNQGYLRIKTLVGALATEIYNNGGTDASLNAINVEKYSGISTLYSPQFTIREDYQTLVNIINAHQQEAATVTLTLHAANGTVMGTPLTVTLPKNGQLKGNLWNLFQNDPSLLNQTGWLEVSSTKDFIVGTVSFTNLDSTFLTSFHLSGHPLAGFVYPLVSEDATYETELSLLNTSGAAATVTLELWPLAGGTAPASTATVTIANGSNSIAKVSELFPGQQHRTANIRVRSTQPLHSFAIIADRGERFISAVPPVQMPATE